MMMMTIKRGYELIRYKSEHEIAIYRGVNPENKPAFVVLLPPSFDISVEKWPKLSGLDMHIEENENERRFILLLLQRDLENVFTVLRDDLAASALKHATHKSVVNDIRTRLTGWHKLLNSGMSSLLSLREQLGLMGELLEIEKLMHQKDSTEILQAWLGPLKGPHDFMFADQQREVKALTDLQRNAITITSAHQLAGVKEIPLVLSVHRLEKSPTGQSLNDKVVQVLSLMKESDADLFMERLHAVGYVNHPAYSENSWVCLNNIQYLIDDEFPRLTHEALPDEILEVEYKLSLAKLNRWKMEG